MNVNMRDILPRPYVWITEPSFLLTHRIHFLLFFDFALNVMETQSISLQRLFLFIRGHFRTKYNILQPSKTPPSFHSLTTKHEEGQ